MHTIHPNFCVYKKNQQAAQPRLKKELCVLGVLAVRGRVGAQTKRGESSKLRRDVSLQLSFKRDCRSRADLNGWYIDCCKTERANYWGYSLTPDSLVCHHIPPFFKAVPRLVFVCLLLWLNAVHLMGQNRDKLCICLWARVPWVNALTF